MGQFVFRFALPVLIVSLCGRFGFAWTHMARSGETLEQLSVRYYGTPDKTVVIRAANGFVHPDNGRLTEGEPVEIPEVLYIRVTEADSWQTLANAFLSSPIRAPFLAGLNGFDESKMPPVGTIIQIPFHLRHIFAADESLKSIVRMYYRGKTSVDWLIRYNSPTKKKYGQGDVIIVPLADLVFTDEEQTRIEAFRADRYTRLDLKRQEEAREIIASLKEDFDMGRYVQIVANASKLIGFGRLTVPQEIGVYNFLAYAYVALDESKSAEAAFRRALDLQPDMELSSLTSSPKILEVFKRAKDREEASRPKP
jgi:tetratricopeptide (TPR) repeat protein